MHVCKLPFKTWPFLNPFLNETQHKPFKLHMSTAVEWRELVPEVVSESESINKIKNQIPNRPEITLSSCIGAPGLSEENPPLEFRGRPAPHCTSTTEATPGLHQTEPAPEYVTKNNLHQTAPNNLNWMIYAADNLHQKIWNGHQTICITESLHQKQSVTSREGTRHSVPDNMHKKAPDNLHQTEQAPDTLY